MKALKTLLALFAVAILCFFTSFVYADLAPAPWINPAKEEYKEGNNQYNYPYNTSLNPYVVPAYVFGPVYSFENNPISVNTLWNTNLSTPWNTNLFTPWNTNLFTPWNNNAFTSWNNNLYTPWNTNVFTPWNNNLYTSWNNNLFTQANSIFLPFYF